MLEGGGFQNNPISQKLCPQGVYNPVEGSDMQRLNYDTMQNEMRANIDPSDMLWKQRIKKV